MTVTGYDTLGAKTFNSTLVKGCVFKFLSLPNPPVMAWFFFIDLPY